MGEEEAGRHSGDLVEWDKELKMVNEMTQRKTLYSL